MRDNQQARLYAAEAQLFRRETPEDKRGLRRFFKSLLAQYGVQDVELVWREGGARSYYHEPQYRDGEVVAPARIRLLEPLRWELLHRLAHHIVHVQYGRVPGSDEWLQPHGYEFAAISTALYGAHLGLAQNKFDLATLHRIYAQHGVEFFRGGKR